LLDDIKQYLQLLWPSDQVFGPKFHDKQLLLYSESFVVIGVTIFCYVANEEGNKQRNMPPKNPAILIKYEYEYLASHLETVRGKNA